MRIVFTSINRGRQLFDPRGPLEGITFPMNCRGKIIPFPSDISRFSRDTAPGVADGLSVVFHLVDPILVFLPKCRMVADERH